jgi:hypothetical protein
VRDYSLTTADHLGNAPVDRVFDVPAAEKEPHSGFECKVHLLANDDRHKFRLNARMHKPFATAIQKFGRHRLANLGTHKDW